jgi:hypothetical protein
MTTRSRARRVVSLVCAVGLTCGGATALAVMARGGARQPIPGAAVSTVAAALGIGLVWIFADLKDWWKGE